ncbi:MAG: T9SS type A sorting domain-containing protein [Bacteroidota bacterium]
MKRLTFILILSFTFTGGTMFSQRIDWSLFSSGFARSQTASTTLMGVVGEPIVGFSQTSSASIYSGSLSRNFVLVTGVSVSNGQVPLHYALYQNYPNPFNPSTTIRYDLPAATLVTIRIFDIHGQQISTVVDEEKPAGAHQVSVTLPNLSSGVYFYRILTSDYVKTRKFILLR